MPAPVDTLRSYEDSVLVPVVERAGLEPVRGSVDFTLTPGTIVALMNGAGSHTHVGDALHWAPLSVVYCDRNGVSGTAYSLMASFDYGTGVARFEQAKLHGIMTLRRLPTAVVWIDPHSGKQLLSFPFEEADKMLLNSWYLFQGGILPLLRDETYRFALPHERFSFRAMMMRRINAVFRDSAIVDSMV
jgi:hypothetical protein